MTAWHVSPPLLAQYASEPETIDEVAASSLELHLLRCEACRVALSASSDERELEMSWAAIAEVVDAPRATPIERLLRLVGFSDTWARLVGATRALQLSSLVALVVVVIGSVLVAQRVDSAAPFLVIAPVVPLAAIALAFVPGADPAGEAGAAAPLSGLGLVLRRAVVVLGVALIALLLGSVALPGFDAVDAAWVLPALGLSLGALALATWVRIVFAVTALGAAWLGALWVAASREPRPVSVPDLAPLAASGQVVCGVLAVAAAVVLILRRNELALLGRSTTR
jgi:hypothetical protein